MTPKGGDKVSEQRQQGEAKVSVLAITPAQVSSQCCREGLRETKIRLRLLEQHKPAVKNLSVRWVDDVNLND